MLKSIHRNRMLAATAALVAAMLPLNSLSAAPMLPPCPASPNCVSSQATDSGQRVEPFAFTDTPVAAQARLVRVLEKATRAKIVEASPGALSVEFTSLIFRFVDDVRFELDANARVFHLRSASRTGHSDMGVNRRRVEALRTAFAAER